MMRNDDRLNTFSQSGYAGLTDQPVQSGPDRSKGGSKSASAPLRAGKKKPSPAKRATPRTRKTTAKPVAQPLNYPFSAIVGQEGLKRAMLIASVDPGVGGVLALGDRGTGKSTAVRALASLLPDIETINGCQYNCKPGAPAQVSGCDACRSTRKASRPVPVVDLPLGATEDRLVGAIDIERALTEGVRVFEPGLLAKANRGFLYIDEVNLLEDHLVDLLLDVAASGQNVVEREGLGIRHPARFVLVGSGNPEEGELRPQLLDRFGLAVDVTTPVDRSERVEIVRRREEYDNDRAGFCERWREADLSLRKQVVTARSTLDQIAVREAAYLYAADLCLALGTDGLRGELTLIKAARAAAALDARPGVSPADIAAVAPMALRHRLRKDPLDETSSEVRVLRAIDDLPPDQQRPVDGPR